MDTRKHWIGVVSRSHSRRGVAGGFIQLNHGNRAPLACLAAGDLIAIYSPRTDYPDGPPLQAFTAIGRVTTGEVYQVAMSSNFKPFRTDVQFFPCVEAPIRPLIPALSFITNKQRWSAPFRFGYLRIPESDFTIIGTAMTPPAEGSLDAKAPHLHHELRERLSALHPEGGAEGAHEGGGGSGRLLADRIQR